MVDFNRDYFEQDDPAPWKPKRLTAWELQGLSDAVAHLKTATANNDQSAIETSTTFIIHHARKLL